MAGMEGSMEGWREGGGVEGVDGGAEGVEGG